MLGRSLQSQNSAAAAAAAAAAAVRPPVHKMSAISDANITQYLVAGTIDASSPRGSSLRLSRASVVFCTVDAQHTLSCLFYAFQENKSKNFPSEMNAQKGRPT